MAAEVGLPQIGVENAVKVSVSLPRDVVREVRARVGARQFSAFVAQAVEQRLRLEMLSEIVDDYISRRGPLPEDMAREVDAEWRAALGR